MECFRSISEAPHGASDVLNALMYDHFNALKDALREDCAYIRNFLKYSTNKGCYAAGVIPVVASRVVSPSYHQGGARCNGETVSWIEPKHVVQYPGHSVA